MGYRFREIRLSERGHVRLFAINRGASYDRASLRHYMSLVATANDEIVAAALCIEAEDRRYRIQIIREESADSELIAELTDRCLRKMQSNGIAMARIESEDEGLADELWAATSWLGRIEETPPPQLSTGVASQAVSAGDAEAAPA